MTGSSHDPMDAVSALMEERSRYESWLATLESRRASTPNHVYDRVRGDYQARLKGVLDQLSGRASELQGRADQLGARVAELQRQEDAHRDERAEAELRAAVGEHTPEQWQEMRERADREIARLSAERAAIAADAERVRQVLAAATPPRSAPAVGGSTAPAGIGGDGGARRPAPEPLVRPADPPKTTPRGGSFDELAFLKSVVPSRGSTPPAAESTGASDGLHTSPGATAGAGNDRGARTERVIDSPPFGTTVSRARPESSGRPSPETGTRSANEGVPAFLKDVPSEQVKTLKCQECGTMNYPTEWYCERCGGELAAM